MVHAAIESSAVTEACATAADPVLARHALERVLDAHPRLADEVAAGGTLLDVIIALSGASEALVAMVVADDSVLGDVRGGDITTARTEDEYRDAVGGALDAADGTDEGMLRALRRYKHREVLRIAARDLLGIADLRAVGRELAGLAQSCLAGALRIADPQVPMTIVGMGKLGGRELNYASDVDVMFVHEGAADTAVRAARDVLRVMTARTADGIVFRTDANLRPEGRNGPLSRTLDAYESYWDRWAASWEMQALLKARAVAGDAELGARFSELATPRVWPDVMDRDRIREIRLMKERAEELLAREGLTEREVKRGRGGIRDIEFAVQLLQMVHGRHDPGLRTANTLDGLEALADAGYVAPTDATALDAAYVWLRTVEHRLQLWQEQQTHTIPDDEAARDRLARALGLRGTPASSALEQFEERHRAEQATVRRLHEQLFFSPILETLAGTGRLSLDAAIERLEAFGFHDVEQTRTALAELTTGFTQRSRVLADLFPAILGWLADGADPDLGLLQLRRLAEGYTRSQSLARLFRETPHAGERLCRVLGSSRVLGVALHRQPEAVADLADDERLEREPDVDELREEALGTLDWRHDEEGRWAGLRRFKRRQLLRIGTRDLLGFTDVAGVGRELSRVADTALEAALRSLEPEIPFAVIGMGRLGGSELSYASDIDVLFVYEGDGAAAFELAEKTATRLMRAIGSTTADGQTWHIDADLRPEGRKGVLARSLAGYHEYYERWAETWEFQSLLRARPVAGDAELGRRFVELIEPYVYRPDFSAEQAREIRRMKARIEKERIPAGDDPRYHLKLGPGSLSDVEFTVQLLQLQHGAAEPELRSTSTKSGLWALTERGRIDPADAEVLAEAYDVCERARNHRYLLVGSPSDSLPTDDAEARRVGRMMGYTHAPASSLRNEYRRVTRRARAVVERVFYEQS